MSKEHTAMRLSRATLDALDELAKMEDSSRTKVIESAICSYIKARVRNDCAGVTAPFHRLDDVDRVSQTFLTWLKAKRGEEGVEFKTFEFIWDFDGKPVIVLAEADGKIVNEDIVAAFLMEDNAKKLIREQSK